MSDRAGNGYVDAIDADRRARGLASEVSRSRPRHYVVEWGGEQ